MAANLENSAMATGLEKVSFHCNPKEKQCQRMLKLLHNCTHLTCQQSNAQNSPSQASAVHETINFQMFKLVLEKAEEPEIKLPTSTGSSKKQKSSRKTSISALLTTANPLTVWNNKLWKILQEMGIPDHLTCLLRNMYAGQEATVRTGHGTTDWLQIGKGVLPGCILSPGLFNLHAEYIMRNTGLDEAHLESRLPGEKSITSDMQMTPPLWQKVKKNSKAS